MNDALYRYWILPSRWRRWPRWKRWCTGSLLAVSIFWLSSVPFRVWRPESAWQGRSGYEVLQDGMLFFMLVNLASALVGAAAIAGERERGTWEALLLTRLGVTAIVRAKLLSRAALMSGLVALTLPFWLMWTYQVLEVNNRSSLAFYADAAAFAPAKTALRIGLFLSWLSVRLVGRVLTFATLGLAISARSRQTRRALALTGFLITLLCVTLWVENGLLCVVFGYPSLPLSLAGRVIGWPMLPNDFEYFTQSGIVSTLWREDLLADALWLVLLPSVFFRLAVRWGRRPDRVANWFERRSHEF
jgi:hypothetical protein